MPQHVFVDALVVGAGFGGIYATYHLRQLGLDVKCIDIAEDVGGTWYWNKYPAWDDELHRWRVSTATDGLFLTRHLVNCLGVLSKPNYPDIPGLDSFSGRLIHTARWDDTITLSGKKIGVIGNGSTGIQVMTAIAPIVADLKSFQRHPQYSVPSGQDAISSAYHQNIKSRYKSIWESVKSSAVGFGVPEVNRKTMQTTPREREAAFQKAWQRGNGFRFMFSTFGDIVSDESANEETCKFIRGKIDEVVTDSRFDAIEGNYLHLSIHGRGGKTIQEHWQNGPKAYGGIACAGFPNMFLVSGPQAPFANFPPVIESEIEFIMACIDRAEKHNVVEVNKQSRPMVMELTEEAKNEWSILCEQLVEGLLFKKTRS
ncbi:uncharacterized protein A1O9_10458 [Exophiala aquamarina CBS 119918]|uniref:FAD/NAD(P)-binding domain-containing protein n=1 Tax=Exophiala aquamarina CBS 119918 TaxID=1182545 RepID=A0A072P2H4_9EURO|nr:uncharacterized protein A1O9_10458 [Exophiala aquamarina CBS 119918]KEF53483.1 hypothetical protein A1O9_10458 [Exophiala aquamarina CBS 119918]